MTNSNSPVREETKKNMSVTETFADDDLFDLDPLPDLDDDNFLIEEMNPEEMNAANTEEMEVIIHTDDFQDEDMLMTDEDLFPLEILDDDIPVSINNNGSGDSAQMISFVPHEDYLISDSLLKKINAPSEESNADKALSLASNQNLEARDIPIEDNALSVAPLADLDEPLFLDETDEETKEEIKEKAGSSAVTKKDVTASKSEPGQDAIDFADLPGNITLNEHNEIVIIDSTDTEAKQPDDSLGDELSLTAASSLQPHDMKNISENKIEKIDEEKPDNTENADTITADFTEKKSTDGGFFSDAMDEDDKLALSDEELGDILGEISLEETDSDIDLPEDDIFAADSFFDISSDDSFQEPSHPLQKESQKDTPEKSDLGQSATQFTGTNDQTFKQDKNGSMELSVDETKNAEGGFFADSDDEDDTLALSHEELGDILNDVTSEEAAEETVLGSEGVDTIIADSPEKWEEEAALEDDEQISLDMDSLDLDLDDNDEKSSSIDSSFESLESSQTILGSKGDDAFSKDLSEDYEDENISLDMNSLDLGLDEAVTENLADDLTATDATPINESSTESSDSLKSLESSEFEEDENISLDMDALDLDLSVEDDTRKDFGFVMPYDDGDDINESINQNIFDNDNKDSIDNSIDNIEESMESVDLNALDSPEDFVVEEEILENPNREVDLEEDTTLDMDTLDLELDEDINLSDGLDEVKETDNEINNSNAINEPSNEDSNNLAKSLADELPDVISATDEIVVDDWDGSADFEDLPETPNMDNLDSFDFNETAEVSDDLDTSSDDAKTNESINEYGDELEWDDVQIDKDVSENISLSQSVDEQQKLDDDAYDERVLFIEEDIPDFEVIKEGTVEISKETEKTNIEERHAKILDEISPELPVDESLDASLDSPLNKQSEESLEKPLVNTMENKLGIARSTEDGLIMPDAMQRPEDAQIVHSIVDEELKDLNDDKEPPAPLTDHEALTGKENMPSRPELKKMLTYLDSLFENLPDEAVKEFARSEYFDLYMSILKKLEMD